MSTKQIRAPMPGTFYRSSAPDQPPFKLDSDASLLLTARVEFGRVEFWWVNRRLRHRGRVVARWHRSRRERRARCVLHRAGPERHEHRADRLVLADGSSRRTADSRGDYRSVPLPHADRARLKCASRFAVDAIVQTAFYSFPGLPDPGRDAYRIGDGELGSPSINKLEQICLSFV